MNSDRTLDKLLSTSIRFIDENSSFEIFKFILSVFMIYIPIIVIFLLFTLVFRLIDWVTDTYKWVLKNDLRTWVMLRVFLRKTI